MEKLLDKLVLKHANTPYGDIDIALLGGDPPFHRAENQAMELPRPIVTDIKNAARKAGTHVNAYTTIRQSGLEPFGSFLNQLTQAVETFSPRMQVKN